MVQVRSRAHIRVQTVANQIKPSYANHALSGNAVVCVTGAAGYVGGWLVTLCLKRGYSVRACVRNVDDERKVGFLKAMPEYQSGKLTLHAADMTVPGAYDQIFEGCSTVFHPAEVFMSFSTGRDRAQASKDFTVNSAEKKVTGKALHSAATLTAQYVVDSINRSSTVTRLVYTASIASMMGSDFRKNPIVDESCEAAGSNPNEYGPTKRITEKYFDYAAYASGGKWSMVTGNPGDIVGPILSPHQASETWQGKIGGVIQGNSVPQEPGGRPWALVDVRDVAEAQIRLAESSTLRSGDRFMLASGDLLPAETIGIRAMELHPEWDCPTTVAPMEGKKEIMRVQPQWLRVQMRNDKIRREIGFEFRSFDDTFKATVDSLVQVGGVKPNLKK